MAKEKLRISEQLDPIEQACVEAARKACDAKGDVDKARCSLAQIERYSGNQAAQKLAQIGRSVPAIKEALDSQKHRFSGHLPIGPVGFYIKVRDSRWTKAVADCIGFSLSTWLVDGQAESDLCYAILKEARNKRQIESFDDSDFKCNYVNPDRFDPARSSSKAPSVLDMITIEHPDERANRAIQNFLIDHCAANEVLLFEHFAQAAAQMRKNPETIKLSNGVRKQLKQVCYAF